MYEDSWDGLSMDNMTKPPRNILDLPLGERAKMALKEAVANAIEEHVRCGRPVYVGRDGKVVDISEELRASSR
jgi:hypothetical protein